jgi:hypothetical protein
MLNDICSVTIRARAASLTSMMTLSGVGKLL